MPGGSKWNLTSGPHAHSGAASKGWNTGNRVTAWVEGRSSSNEKIGTAWPKWTEKWM